MATLFNPVFQMYNEAITAHDRSLQVTQYIDNSDDTRILTQQQYDAINDPDKECDYGAMVTGPVTDAGRAQYGHVDAIKVAVTGVAATSPGNLNLAVVSNDDRYRLEGAARSRKGTGSKGKPEVTHTMGDYLLPAFKEFENLQLKNANFWEWVEEKIASDPDGSATAKKWNPALYKSTEAKYHQHLVRWFQKGVKYVNEKQTRDRYQMTFKNGLLLRRLHSSDMDPQLFDKKEVVDAFTKKGNPPGALIWVMGSGAFYSHMAKTGRFHHSSFFEGGAITAAGEWDVEAGKLKWISGRSGHYRPGFSFLADAVNALPVEVFKLAGGKVRLFKQSAAQDLDPGEFLKRVTPDTLTSDGLTAFPV